MWVEMLYVFVFAKQIVYTVVQYRIVYLYVLISSANILLFCFVLLPRMQADAITRVRGLLYTTTEASQSKRLLVLWHYSTTLY